MGRTKVLPAELSSQVALISEIYANDHRARQKGKFPKYSLYSKVFTIGDSVALYDCYPSQLSTQIPRHILFLELPCSDSAVRVM